MKQILLLLTLFFMTNTFCQNKSLTKKQVDSILTEGKTLEKGFDRILFYNNFSGRNAYPEITKPLLNESLKIAKELQKPRLLGNAYYALGNYYYYKSKLDSCDFMLNKAEKYTLEADLPFLKSQILATKGGVFKKKDEISTSVKYYQDAKTILEKIDTLSLTDTEKKKRRGQTMILNNTIANAYNKLEDFETSILYYDLAIDGAKLLKDTFREGILVSNKGDLLLKTDKYKEALEAFKLGKKLKEEGNAPITFIATSDFNIGKALHKIGNNDQALSFYNKALIVYEESKIENKIAEVLSARGVLLLEENNFEEALIDCNRAKKIVDDLGIKELLARTCDCLYKVYKEKGDYKLSLANHELLTQAKDSLMNEKNIRNLTQLEMRYQFNKVEEEQGKILNVERKKKRNITVGLIVLAIFSLLTIYSLRKRLQYKTKLAKQTEAIQEQKITGLQQKNKLLAMSSMIEGQEVERLRIAKDLHDSVGGLLSTVKAHFTTIQNEIKQLEEYNLTGKTNSLIDEACGEVRRISHNMMPHALSISGLKGTIEDLGEHLNQQGYIARVEISNIPEKLDVTKEIMIYRLIQENISNIIKHSQAKNILIQMIGFNKELKITIEDDGSGFDYNEAIEKGGLGLKSINSRVEFLDGTIDWDTLPTKGTTLYINIPIS